MSKYSYKGMIVTADSKDDAKAIDHLVAAYINLLDNLITKDFSLVKDMKHIYEKDGAIIVEAKYSVTNSKNIKFTISIVLTLKDGKDGVILNNSTLDYEVSVGDQFIFEDSLNGAKLTGKALKDELANSLILAKAFSEL